RADRRRRLAPPRARPRGREGRHRAVGHRLPPGLLVARGARARLQGAAVARGRRDPRRAGPVRARHEPAASSPLDLHQRRGARQCGARRAPRRVPRRARVGARRARQLTTPVVEEPRSGVPKPPPPACTRRRPAALPTQLTPRRAPAPAPPPSPPADCAATAAPATGLYTTPTRRAPRPADAAESAGSRPAAFATS